MLLGTPWECVQRAFVLCLVEQSRNVDHLFLQSWRVTGHWIKYHSRHFFWCIRSYAVLLWIDHRLSVRTHRPMGTFTASWTLKERLFGGEKSTDSVRSDTSSPVWRRLTGARPASQECHHYDNLLAERWVSPSRFGSGCSHAVPSAGSPEQPCQSSSLAWGSGLDEGVPRKKQRPFREMNRCRWAGLPL